jgi:4'-phosphopantetheinyl transferase EntD
MTPLESLFPPGVRCVFSDQPPVALALMPAEADAARNMAKKRAREFAHGRACARQALAELGYPGCPIPVGDHRAPEWPPDIVGSISHSGDQAAAVAARKSEYQGLGVDLETREPLEPSLLNMICRPGELDQLKNAKNDPTLAKVIFSAKESLFKCVWPTLRRFIDFQDIELQLDIERKRFRAAAHSKELPAQVIGNVCGRWTETGGLIVSAAYAQ